jgi:hypothetical protein
MDSSDDNQLVQAIWNACYAEFVDHLSAAESAEDSEAALAMMEPHHFRRIGENAVRAVASTKRRGRRSRPS